MIRARGVGFSWPVQKLPASYEFLIAADQKYEGVSENLINWLQNASPRFALCSSFFSIRVDGEARKEREKERGRERKRQLRTNVCRHSSAAVALHRI